MTTPSEPEPRLARPYVLTGGRTLGASDLPLEAVVVTEAPRITVILKPA